jgi:hypothetical protein
MPNLLRRLLAVTKWTLRVLGWTSVAILTLWSGLALRYSPLLALDLRSIAAWTFGGTAVAAVVFWRPRWRPLLGLTGAWAVIAGCFIGLQPQADRDWHPSVAVLSHTQFDGDLATIRNVRDFDWTGPDAATPRYHDGTYDLRQLTGVDLVCSYWDGNEAIAHTMLCFDFGPQGVLCLSVEVRATRGQEYGALPGMFKSYEIAYMLGEERDLLQVRAVHRHEELYMFRTTLGQAEAALLLRAALQRANGLSTTPQFYRTLLNNCTTSLIDCIDEVWPDRTAFAEKILMNGYAPEHAYEHGILRTSLPFDEYKRRSRITDAARAAAGAPDFSRRIRAGLPKD